MDNLKRFAITYNCRAMISGANGKMATDKYTDSVVKNHKNNLREFLESEDVLLYRELKSISVKTKKIASNTNKQLSNLMFGN